MQEKIICSWVLFWLPFIVEGGKYEKLFVHGFSFGCHLLWKGANMKNYMP